MPTTCFIKGGTMSQNTDEITFFSPYPFAEGEKIHIENGPRKGDWEVLEVTDQKIRLRCPVSFREFNWNRFCYFVKKRRAAWPQD
jgi:hypothetical protein